MDKSCARGRSERSGGPGGRRDARPPPSTRALPAAGSTPLAGFVVPDSIDGGGGIGGKR
jgi:hypothetical protein